MIRQIFVLLFALLLIIQINSTAIKNIKPKANNISPYDIKDEAQAELDDLKSITNSATQQGYRDLESLSTAATGDLWVALNDGETSIRQAYQDIDAKLTTIKDLAFGANQNISSCLDGREDVLGTLPGVYVDRLSDCFVTSNIMLTDIANDARYYVGIIFTKVYELQFQLDRCDADSIACISPLVTDIEQQMVLLPQKIQVEVDKAADLYERYKAAILNCTSDKIATATSEGNTILREISDCADGILG